MLCKLTPEEEVRMHILLKGIADDPNALEMQKFIQHGSVTTYEHCLRVTRIAFWLNIHLHVRADEASLVKGAFLHDFYLYDWHNCSNITHWHGFKHARIARYNAETVFKLTDKEKDIIQSHMWPLNPTDIPHSREAALVCMADKMSSSYETVLERKAKRRNKTLLGPLCEWRPQRVGERTLPRTEIFRSYVKFSPSSPAGPPAPLLAQAPPSPILGEPVSQREARLLWR